MDGHNGVTGVLKLMFRNPKQTRACFQIRVLGAIRLLECGLLE